MSDIPPATPERVRAFHAAYVRETELPMSLGFDRQRSWHTLLTKTFGEPPAALEIADLVQVIRYLRSGIAKGERNPGCLRFRNLIEQPDYFEEELAMARKVASLRQRSKPRPEAVTTALPNGGSVTRLDQRQPQSEPVPIDEATERFMRDYRERQSRRQSQPQPAEQ